MPTDSKYFIEHDPKYQKFIKETGLQISRSTFYRIKRELKDGRDNTLTRIINREYYHKELHISRPDHSLRPFLGFDGEGQNKDDKHLYVLLVASNGDFVYNPDGLSTYQALTFLLKSSKQTAIRVFYSFGYDIQQICRDLPDHLLERLMHGQVVKYYANRRLFTLQYLPNKIFMVNNVRFYDVFNFWQTSFLNAVYETFGGDEIPDFLIKGKEARSEFASWNIKDILKYTNEELRLLVKLCEHLQTIFLKAGIDLKTNFYGPGAIANYWFRHYQIAPPKIEKPELVDVMERAYFGGRFEAFILGKNKPIHEYDINSAYPSAIAKLQYVDDFRRVRSSSFENAPDISVWHCEWHLPNTTKVGPFPSRNKQDYIIYPANGRGWYWKPEVEAALNLYPDAIQILEGYIPQKIWGAPFHWVEETYNRRQELKANNDPAQWGLKVGLNSLYGKTAQRVGSARYFNLAWAGYITSATRAKLLRAVKGHEDALVAFATDALYLTEPAKELTVNKFLGNFTHEKWDYGYIIQSGVYRMVRKVKGEEKPEIHDAYRGFSVKNGLESIINQLEEKPFSKPKVYQLKFVGHLEAIKCKKALGPYRLTFINIKKKLDPFKVTKRRVGDLDQVILNYDITLSDDGEEIPPYASEEDIILTYRSSGVKHTLFYSYLTLLKRSIPLSILIHHNDRNVVERENEEYELEDSYPFIKHDLNENVVSYAITDDNVATERMGGAAGLIDVSKLGSYPLIDEADIERDLLSNG